MSEKKSLYAMAGVDIDAADKAKVLMKKLVESTYNDSVVGGHGAFGGMYSLKNVTGTNQVLIGSSDGVGTKVKLAIMTGRHNTVGQDLVNHCVDDILCCGAKPLFFFDYLGLGKINSDVVTSLVEGLSIACKENDMVLLGGETAEMPGFYGDDEYDLAGFIVGWVDREKIVDGSRIEAGDVLIGLPSTGLHTNGYSLARRAFFDIGKMGCEDKIEETGTTVSDELLNIHKSYLKPVMPLIDKELIKGIAHITGGGFEGNINRIMPNGLTAVVDTNTWQVPGVFAAIKRLAEVSTEEMYRVFNMGIGMVLACRKAEAQAIRDHIKSCDIDAREIGEVKSGKNKVELMF